jgi:hypothetical protein
MKTIFACIIFAFASGAYAQSQQVAKDTITWHSDESKELHSNEVIVLSCSFVTNETMIRLSCGADAFDFPIVNVQGEWHDVNEVGSLVYAVTYQDHSGTIVIERVATGTSILVDFTGATPDGMKRKFTITNIELQ